MTILDKLDDQKTLITDFWTQYFKCVAFPAFAVIDPNIVDDCCDYLTQLLESGNFPYEEQLKRYCGNVPDPPVIPIPPPQRPDPDLEIVKPPKRVIRDEEGNDDFLTDEPIDDRIPILPRRFLPPQPIDEPIITDNENNFTSYVCETLSTREYGCLIHDPFVDQPFSYCYHGEEPNTFWTQLLDKTKEILENILQDNLDDATRNICTFGIARLPLPFFQKAVIIFGCNLLDEIAYYFFTRNKNIVNFPLGGSVFTQSSQNTQCLEFPVEDTPNVDENLKQCDLGTECAIPISFYSRYQEYGNRLAQQLTIIFRTAGYSATNKRVKQISIPSVPLDFDLSAFLLLLPDWLYFGQGRFECQVVPYGYIRYYGLDYPEESTVEEVRQWFENLITTLVRDDTNATGSIRQDTFRLSRKTRNYTTGWYYPHSYQLQGFGDDDQAWKCLRGDRITQGQPSVNPPPVDPNSWFVKF